LLHQEYIGPKPKKYKDACSQNRSAGGWLYQEADNLVPEKIEFTAVSETQPTAEQLQDLKFAWLCVKHVKSNAITIAKGQRLLGMGSGQPNRVKSVEIALEKAGEDVKVSRLLLPPPSQHIFTLSAMHRVLRCIRRSF